MEKGNLGIKVSVLASIAFLVAFFSGVAWSVAFLAFVLVAEKSEWLKKQAIEAVLFAASFAVLGQAVYLVKTIPLLPGFIRDIVGYVDYPIAIIEALFVFIAVVHVAKGEDSNLPLIGDLTNKALDIAAPAKDETTV